MKQRGFRYCRICQNKLQKRSKTAAGTQRWQCTLCRRSTTRPRLDLSRSFVFEGFTAWLLGKASQAELTVAARSFRNRTSWCWAVATPPVLTGEIHHSVIVDGIRVSDQVCLIARTTAYVIAWAWVPYESSRHWEELFNLLPPPMYVVCDGQKGLLKALNHCWPQTIVQRCRFHVWLNVKTKLTLHPQSTASQELLQLSRQLLHVRTRRQARYWKRQLRRWYRKHRGFIQERSPKHDPSPGGRSWRYTHQRLRSAYRQLNKQTDDLLRASYRPHPALPSTTNHIEGGINSQLRALLKLHRGMKHPHQKVLVNWYLYSRTENPKPPRKCL